MFPIRSVVMVEKLDNEDFIANISGILAFLILLIDYV